MTSRRGPQNSSFPQDLSEFQREKRRRRVAKLTEAVKKVVPEALSKSAKSLGKQLDESGRKRLEGHPYTAAMAYVAETFGEFDLHGQMKARVVRMDRTAGSGAFGVVDGKITVDVELRPLRGMTQTVEVPVTVQDQYLVQPSLFYHAGVPYILAQSSIDEVLEQGKLHYDNIRHDRKTMYGMGRFAGYAGFSKREADVLQDVERWYDLQNEKEMVEDWAGGHKQSPREHQQKPESTAELAWAVDRVFELEDEMAALKATIEDFMAESQRSAPKKDGPWRTLWKSLRQFRADAQDEATKPMLDYAELVEKWAQMPESSYGPDQLGLQDSLEFEAGGDPNEADYDLARELYEDSQAAQEPIQPSRIHREMPRRVRPMRREPPKMNDRGYQRPGGHGDNQRLTDWDEREAGGDLDCEADLDVEAGGGVRMPPPSSITREEYEQQKARSEGRDPEAEKAKRRRQQLQRDRSKMTEGVAPKFGGAKTAGGYAFNTKLLPDVMTMLDLNVGDKKVKEFLHQNRVPPEMFQGYIDQAQKRLQAQKAKVLEDKPGYKQEFNQARTENQSRGFNTFQKFKTWVDEKKR